MFTGLVEAQGQVLHVDQADEGVCIVDQNLTRVQVGAQQPGILSLVMPGAPAEVWLHHLDSRDVVVSVGSACQANKKEISPVLLAAGLSPAEARRVLRVSLSGSTSAEEIDRALKILSETAVELASL